MAFGQASGPPATARQIAELLALLQDAGHVDFRDARGPMGFTQRQAEGRFTRDEADALISQLQDDADREAEGAPPAAIAPSHPSRSSRAAPAPTRAPRGDAALARFSDQQLAAELQRRGWIVVEP